MKVAGVLVLVLACLVPAWVHAQYEPAVECADFDAHLNGECPSNEGSMCKVSPSPQSRGGYLTENCGNCQKSPGLVKCANGFTFKFTRKDQVEVTYSAQLVTKVYQAVVKFARTACRTKSKPVTANPFRLTTTPANSRTTNNADISYVQVCYNPVDCGYNNYMCGDPKIVGGDGVMFYFHGYKDADFCLVSDSDLHINAHFIGKRPEGRTRDFTWVQGLGFVYGPHSLTVGVKKVAKWDVTVDQLEFTYNGRAFELEGSSWRSDPDETMTINRVGSRNAVDVVVKDKMGVVLTALPIGHEENRVHKYGIGEDDCFAHFNMQFRFFSLSSKVNGVLGQTYQPGFVNPVKRGVAMPIMGGADRFITSSLLATDCKMSQYTATAVALRDKSTLPNLTSCGSSASGALTCRR